MDTSEWACIHLMKDLTEEERPILSVASIDHEIGSGSEKAGKTHEL